MMRHLCGWEEPPDCQVDTATPASQTQALLLQQFLWSLSDVIRAVICLQSERCAFKQSKGLCPLSCPCSAAQSKPWGCGDALGGVPALQLGLCDSSSQPCSAVPCWELGPPLAQAEAANPTHSSEEHPKAGPVTGASFSTAKNPHSISIFLHFSVPVNNIYGAAWENELKYIICHLRILNYTITERDTEKCVQ